MTAVAWLLNLDADLELADPAGFAPSARLARQTDAMAERLLQSANAATSKVHHVRLSSDAPTTICQAWCATPRALASAQAMGHELPARPPLHVIQRVNHRAFAADLGCALRGARFVTSIQQLHECMQVTTPAQGWLMKRPFGFSGRGQKRVAAVPTGGDRRWAEASMSEYGRGLMLEPFVTINKEFALHSWLGPDGACLTGQPTSLVTDDLGAWARSEPNSDLHDHERKQLHAAHKKAAKALTGAGYFGPFSTDAFRYRDDEGGVQFQALSELNARYSMGFFVGLAAEMEEWVRRVGG